MKRKPLSIARLHLIYFEYQKLNMGKGKESVSGFIKFVKIHQHDEL